MNDDDRIIEGIERSKSFLIVSHYNPDGDAIGAMLALAIVLERAGKSVVVYNRDGVPPSLAFLPTSSRIVSKLEMEAAFDMAIMIDVGNRGRVSKEFAQFHGAKITACIDHHRVEKAEADMTMCDPDAASAGVVLYRLLDRAGFEIDAQVAECLYTTIVVDTGFFKYSTTDKDLLHLAASFVEKGALPWNVARNLEESNPFPRMKLLSLALGSIELYHDGRFATMDVTHEMLKQTSATIEMSEEFSAYPRSIEGVEVSAFLKEMDDGKVRLSLRSKDLVDVAEIARKNGGGGHSKAAGFTFTGTLAEAKKKVTEIVGLALRS